MKHLKGYLLVIIITFCSIPTFSQKIEYSFGNNSDVVDTLKKIISWYKKQYKESYIKKLKLYAGIDFCNGQLNLNISSNNNNNKGISRLLKLTSRYIKIESDTYLPVLFDTDILSTEMKIERIAFIGMQGYYILIERDDKYIWKVTRTQITF